MGNLAPLAFFRMLCVSKALGDDDSPFVLVRLGLALLLPEK